MNSVNQRYQVLEVKANLAMPAAAQDLYASDGSFNGLSDGQAVAYDPDTLKTIDGTAATTRGRMAFGVVYDTTGDGMPDQIKHLHGGNFEPCGIDAGVKGHVCGKHEILNFFGDCIQPDVEYGIKVRVKDDQAYKELGPYPRWKERLITLKATVDDCGQCTGNVDEPVFMCKLAKELNKLSDGTWNAYPTYQHLEAFTLTVTNGEFDDISEITIDGGVTPIALNNTTKPGDATKSLISQLDTIVNEIDLALDGKGKAFYVRGIGEDCDIDFYVMSCYTEGNFTITGHTSTYTDQFADITIPNGCKGCSGTDGTFTPAQGITFVTAPVIPDCGCRVSNRRIERFTREIEVVGTLGFKDASTQQVVVQEMVIPENHGYEFQTLAYYQENGGQGREWDPYSAPEAGLHPESHPNSRALNAAEDIECKAGYCDYFITNPGARPEDRKYGGRVITRKPLTHIIVKKGDTTAQASVEAFWNNLRSLNNNCATYPAMDCVQ